ncbi:SdrD B-like domain-containing protein [Salinibacterium sp. NK8237]|uniref:SdrD B-like domain-containing protein n=1 Tax=Salinibacterium sp. NK8237 TaxID=2792038 RepID=UPI0018CE57E4|nr:SdrD B-like domain-containing protein [Salinibacterium sp. NK8237]MBH0130351.1 isopeptide-forming domain-containing fimbrial protein [Salinibacterium sp. NK8237]
MKFLLRSLLVAALLAAGITVPAAVATAAEADIAVDLDRQVSASTLFGDDVSVTLTAQQTSGTNAYNLTFTDILPAGATLVTNSSYGAPQQILLSDGSTKLIWNNVADLSSGAVVSLTYSFTYPTTGTYSVGDVFTGTAEALANTNERTLVKFDANTGDVIEDSRDVGGAAESSTTLVPFVLDKAELTTTESELLRGVHDHQTVYELTITNNGVNPSSDFTITDYLPAGLEFLGCEAADNSAADTEEYAGSGRIVNFPSAVDCDGLVPTTSTVVVDPDGAGPLAEAVYTKVVWTIDRELAAGEVVTIAYAAAIPLRENVAFDGEATANLDNNTGDLTHDEQVLTNYAVTSGTYSGDGESYSDDATATVTAEDVAIQKTVNVDAITQGAESIWTLDYQSSEYALSTGTIVITDTIPDGLEFEGSSPDPISGPTYNDDGTITVSWDAAAFEKASEVGKIEVYTSTLASYRLTGAGDVERPVSSNDSWTNTVDLTTSTTIITDNDATTSEIEILDTSSASQQAEGITLTKRVAEPVAAMDDTCDTISTLDFKDDVAAGAFHPGDWVCYELTVTFPSQLDTLDNVVNDFLPAGFTFIDYAETTLNNVESTFVPVVAGDPSRLLTWNIGNVDKGTTFQVLVTAEITDPAVISDGDITSNLMKMTYKNTAGDVFQLRDSADTLVEKPILALSKGITQVDGEDVSGSPSKNVTVQATEVVTYEILVTNDGGQDATNVEVWDTLPDVLDCADVVATSLGDGSCDSGIITWKLDSLAKDETKTLTYDVTIPANSSAGYSFKNTAGVRVYQGDANTGTPTNYYPVDNIDPTVEPLANSVEAIDEAIVKIASPTIVKSAVTSVIDDDNKVAEATIGELVTYTVTTTIPQGSSVYNQAVVTDVVNSRLLLVGTPTYILSNSSVGASGDAVVGANQSVTVALPTPYENLPDSGADTVVLTITARVLDAAGPSLGNTVKNSATFAWEHANGAQASPITSNEISTLIVEPRIAVKKTSDDSDGIVEPGQPVTYTVAVSNGNGGNVSTAHETVAVDKVPDSVELVDALGDPLEDGDPVGAYGIWHESDREIIFTLNDIQRGETVSLKYDAKVIDPLVSNSAISNTVVVTTTSLDGAATGERTSTSGKTGYQASSTVTLRAPSIGVAKTATPSSRTIGEVIDYTLVVTIPKDVIAYQTTIIDQMPADVRFGSFTSIECDEAGSDCTGISELPSAAMGGTPAAGDRRIGFDLGNVDAATADRVVTIKYSGVVTTAAEDEDTLSNTATPRWNYTDKTYTGSAAVPPNSFYDTAGTPSTADVKVTEPALTISKVVASPAGETDARRAKPGETLTYTVVVSNKNGTSPAYDVVVTDTPDVRVTDYKSDAIDGVVASTDNGTSAGSLEWTIAEIPTGGSVTITYTVTMPLNSATVIANPTVVNTADVTEYFGVPEDDRTVPADFKTYTDVEDDTVTVTLDVASIGDRIWFDINNDGTQNDAEAGVVDEPGIADVKVTVLYAGADGDFATTDDNETYSAVTDSNGDYLVSDLPGGNYRVTVDAATLPAGMTASYDLDGGADTPNGIWQGPLASDAEKRDVDFGYTGTGSIGDFVWFDQDKDGVQDSNEPGLPGVTVTVVSGGLDGDLATTDDNITYTTTTDAAGGYTVALLPAGPYTVTVSGAPTGFELVSDPIGGADATSNVILGAGEDNEDQDFGYAGTGSIGDFVWLDRDGDGDQDSGEPGIVGATVELTWLGADGELGGDDDAVFVTKTDADGKYLFPNLLPGDYSVAVTDGLPEAAVASYDRDGNNDSVTPVSLAPGLSIDTIDFGYDVTSVIGDLVWWDVNKDGEKTADEPGIPGVGIRVTFLGADGVLDTDDDGDDLIFTAETDENGNWAITEIPDGNFIVEVVSGVPAGFAPTFDNDSGTTSPDQVSRVTLVGSDLNQDFGYVGDSSISDTVWLDLNQDGVQDDGEPGLPDAVVTLVWFGPDGVAGNGDDVTFTDTTDSTGKYFFGGLPEGNYTATVDTETLPAGVTPTFDADAGPNQPTENTKASGVGPNSTTAIALPADTDLDNIDFGYVGTGTIGDTVWLDQNGDGIVDDSESGIAQVLVTLTWAGLDGILETEDDVVNTQRTDSEGNYLFEDLPSGLFTVALSELPAGLTATADPDAGFDDTSKLTLLGAEANLDQDFGYRGDAGVGDLLWLDVNNDGIQGENEPGLPGIVMTVTSPGTDGEFGTDDDLIVTTTTDENGNYLVEGLPAGEVKVSYDPTTLTEGFVPSADLDGDVLFETTTELIAGETRLDVDFIVVGSATLNGVVFDDPNGNGVRDSGDKGILNATVNVVWDGPNGPITITVVTDENGAWELTSLPAGTYTATVDLDSVSADYRPSTGTTSTVELPAFGTRSVIQGLTTLMLAFTGSSIALGGLLAGLLLLSGLFLLLPARRVRGGEKQPQIASN